ncbi:DNA polymerase-3 subunit epsilon [Humibacillus xanthopallidus]|uniref:DNA polymerase-3 subunit epsilon n=1 Tax=Humibacillus xanthopallidus TaxID=412689 RepID=A0A543PP84_9MICO|nr:exonuclease domain-containing protein [Humibacillus xanthopallidus]TQN45888.1 DNA polymerase-3 subunit epsilon [Humibacillus xanthopallidus]
MILSRFRVDRRRARQARWAEQAPPGPVRDYLASAPPGPRTDVSDLPLLALDLETTGLDPRADHILSVGFVPVDGLQINLAGAEQLICRADVEVGQSATIHGITDDALAGGIALRDLLERVAAALTGRVLLAHHAVIETGFLSAACERELGVPLPITAVDTMELQSRVLRSHAGEDLPPGALRLGTARANLGLPRYAAHEALTDALACAELYLVQVDRLSGGRPMTLKALQR